MFIHWGLYAFPAGKWGNSDRHSEWIRETARIPVDVYNQFQPQFNPVKFNAEQWMKLAKHAGVKYVTITTKHHDGFALFDSKLTDWDVMNTPFKRDIMKEIAGAARANGIVPCWYHSIMDWHHPDYLPRRTWEEATRPAGDANMDRYVAFLRGQVQELLTNYGDIGVMWFDGEWERTWNHEYGQALYDWCRKLQPSVIVNNRVDVGRGGMAGMSDAGYAGDYGTPEQEVPAQGLPGVDWESCITMNRNWGFNAVDKDFKSTKSLIELLCDVVSKGGNLLLNVGPKADGTFPEQSVERLQQMGDWMAVNSKSIYGTQASPFRKLHWGRCTQKSVGTDTVLYLQVFDWPSNGRLLVPGLGNDVLSATLLGGEKVAVSRHQGDVTLAVGPKAPNAHVGVVELKIKGAPIVYEAPVISTASQMFVKEARATIASGSTALEVRYTLDGSDPNEESALYKGPVPVSRKSATLKARSFHRGKAVTGVTEMIFEKVTPMPPVDKTRLTPGITREIIEGDFDRVADMMKKSGVPAAVDSFALGDLGKREYVGAVYRAVLKIDQDDVYLFNLTSDDGSMMLIDGKVVVDHDGLHSPTDKTGAAALARGAHTLEIRWFNKTGGTALDLRWGRAGDPLKAIRTEELWHGE